MQIALTYLETLTVPVVIHTLEMDLPVLVGNHSWYCSVLGIFNPRRMHREGYGSR